MEFVDPNADFDAANPLRPDAVSVEGCNARGKRCRLINNSGDPIPIAELQTLLEQLIAAEVFGFTTMSAAGGSALNLDRRESAHVQLGEKLYRLIVYRYEARLEPF